MACTRRRSIRGVCRSLEAWRSASGTRPGVLRMKRTDSAFPAGQEQDVRPGYLQATPDTHSALQATRPAVSPPHGAGSAPPRMAKSQATRRAHAPANHRMSPSSRTSSGETAWMVMKLRSSATRKAFGSCGAGAVGECSAAAGQGQQVSDRHRERAWPQPACGASCPGKRAQSEVHSCTSANRRAVRLGAQLSCRSHLTQASLLHRLARQDLAHTQADHVLVECPDLGSSKAVTRMQFRCRMMTATNEGLRLGGQGAPAGNWISATAPSAGL